MAPSLKVTNSLENLLIMAILLPAVVNLVMGMYKIPGYLFGFKDYDILMSLPIKESTVLTAKLAPLYVSDMLYGLVMSAPIFYVYGTNTEMTVMFYVICVVSWLFMPMLPLTLGALISLGIAKLSAITRSNMVQIVVNLILMLVLMGCFMIINPGFSGDSSYSILADIGSYYPPALFFAGGVTAPVNYLYFVAISFIPFATFIAVFARSFKRINSVSTHFRGKSNYKITTLDKKCAFRMLFISERKRFFASTAAALNSGFGVIIYLIVFVLVVFAGKASFESMFIGIDVASVGFYIFCAFGLFVISSTLTTPYCISIEGKGFWHLKALPVRTSTIFIAKLAFNYVLTLPFVLVYNSVVGIVLGTSVVDIFAGTLAVLAVAVFFPLLGLALNLRFVNLTWRSADEIVKRGAPMTVCVIGGIVLMLVTIVVFVVLSAIVPGYTVALAAAVVFIIADAVLWIRLKKTGAKKFAAI